MNNSSESYRTDETWHRLREWTGAQPPSERLAALVLKDSGYQEIDPSHPLGGPDGGRDGLCTFNGIKTIYAVYFPRGEKSFPTIRDKFQDDLASASKHSVARLAFVTNQEVTLREREILKELGGDIEIDIFHLERVALILDTPKMHPVRAQFLNIQTGPLPIRVDVTIEGEVWQLTEAQETFDKHVAIYESRVRKRAEEARVRQEGDEEPTGSWVDQLPTWSVLGFERIPAEQKSMALTDDEIMAEVNKYKEALAGRWDDCCEYLMGFAGIPLQFRVKNLEESFLDNVQIVITVPGTRALESSYPADFHIQRLQDPSWQPYRGPYGGLDPAIYRINLQSKELSWRENAAGDLEITLTLDELRPHPEWRSNEDHPQLLLVAKDDIDTDFITFSYTVTAAGYGDYYEKRDIQIPIHREEMLDATKRVIQQYVDM